jgi:hypothetical protein
MDKPELDQGDGMASLMVALLDSWGVDAAGQVQLLALPAGTRPGAIRHHRQGKPFSDDAQVRARIEHFVGIADALRTSYPHNARMGEIWMNRMNHRFGNRSLRCSRPLLPARPYLLHP